MRGIRQFDSLPPREEPDGLGMLGWNFSGRECGAEKRSLEGIGRFESRNREQVYGRLERVPL
jgi:hypothetical protein